MLSKRPRKRRTELCNCWTKKAGVCNFSARNSRAGKGYANFMGAWNFRILQESLHAHSLLPICFPSGGKCQLSFYGRRGFSESDSSLSPCVFMCRKSGGVSQDYVGSTLPISQLKLPSLFYRAIREIGTFSILKRRRHNVPGNSSILGASCTKFLGITALFKCTLHRIPGVCSISRCIVHKVPRKYSISRCRVRKTPGNYSSYSCIVHKIPISYSFSKHIVHKNLGIIAFLGASCTKLLQITLTAGQSQLALQVEPSKQLRSPERSRERKRERERDRGERERERETKEREKNLGKQTRVRGPRGNTTGAPADKKALGRL